MGKYIIDNQSDLGDSKAFDLCKEVIAYGRCFKENTQFCESMTFEVEGKYYYVKSGINDFSDRLVISNIE